MTRKSGRRCWFFHGMLLVALFLTVGAPAGALANRADSSEGQVLARFTLADLGEKDIVIQAVFDQAQLHFPLPAGWRVERARLYLHLSHGKALLSDRSDLTLLLNDAPAGQIILDSANAGPGVVAVELPPELLRAGDNILLLRIHQRLDEQGCADAGQPGLWVRVQADSEIELEGQEEPLQPDLAHWPAPFATFSPTVGPGVLIVLPPQPTPAELTAAARIAAALGQAGQWAQPPLRALTWDRLDERAASEHWIVVAGTGRVPLAGVAGLTEQAVPGNPNRLALVVTGGNGDELLAAADMLATRSARSGLGGAFSALAPVAPHPLVEPPARTTLAELGWVDRRVRGIGPHDLYYPLDIPYDWQLTNEATINLRFTHARSLAASTSLMAVYVNGFKVADVPLTGRNASDGRLTIQLSPRQVHSGRNWLHVAFELHVRREDCRYRYLEEAWTVIAATSTLNLDHVKTAPPLDLHYLPAPLLVPADLSGALFVLPDQPGAADLTAMVRLAAKLGSDTEADGLRPKATTAGYFDPIAAARDCVVAIGSPETNALLARYDGLLPQPLARENGAILPARGRDLTSAEVAGQTAYVQIRPAPWSRQGVLIVLAAFDGNRLLDAVTAMPALRRHLAGRGNVAVVAAGQVVGLEMGGLAGVPLSPAVRQTLSLVLIGTVLTAGGAGLLAARRRRATMNTPSEEHDADH